MNAMTSRVSSKIRRRSAEDRRAELLAASRDLALREGLDNLTLRSVAEQLGVAGSLVSHYFPTVDGLLAEAFGSAAAAELNEIFAAVDSAETPLEGLRTLLSLTVSDDRDRISLLWLDAWHAGRRRPMLHVEVAHQMENWLARMTGLIEDGRAAGEFATANPYASAIRILAVLDGLSIQAVMRSTIDYRAVEELVVIVAEQELGLPRGALASSG
jgi:AcrR family transcriptional regulator